MRLRPSLLLLGALIFAAGTARAVDRGQFENIPDDIRAWFKGGRSPGRRYLLRCFELSTTYAPDVIGYQSTARGGAGEGGHSKRW
jgi:hypothetical protein